MSAGCGQQFGRPGRRHHRLRHSSHSVTSHTDHLAPTLAVFASPVFPNVPAFHGFTKEDIQLIASLRPDNYIPPPAAPPTQCKPITSQVNAEESNFEDSKIVQTKTARNRDSSSSDRTKKSSNHSSAQDDDSSHPDSDKTAPVQEDKSEPVTPSASELLSDSSQDESAGSSRAARRFKPSKKYLESDPLFFNKIFGFSSSKRKKQDKPQAATDSPADDGSEETHSDAHLLERGDAIDLSCLAIPTNSAKSASTATQSSSATPTLNAFKQLAATEKPIAASSSSDQDADVEKKKRKKLDWSKVSENEISSSCDVTTTSSRLNQSERAVRDDVTAESEELAVTSSTDMLGTGREECTDEDESQDATRSDLPVSSDVVELNTEVVANQVLAELSRLGLPVASLSGHTACPAKTLVSILDRPRPWATLRAVSRQRFVRMYAWLQLPDHARLQLACDSTQPEPQPPSALSPIRQSTDQLVEHAEPDTSASDDTTVVKHTEYTSEENLSDVLDGTEVIPDDSDSMDLTSSLGIDESVSTAAFDESVHSTDETLETQEEAETPSNSKPLLKSSAWKSASPSKVFSLRSSGKKPSPSYFNGRSPTGISFGTDPNAPLKSSAKLAEEVIQSSDCHPDLSDAGDISTGYTDDIEHDRSRRSLSPPPRKKTRYQSMDRRNLDLEDREPVVVLSPVKHPRRSPAFDPDICLDQFLLLSPEEEPEEERHSKSVRVKNVSRKGELLLCEEKPVMSPDTQLPKLNTLRLSAIGNKYCGDENTRPPPESPIEDPNEEFDPPQSRRTPPKPAKQPAQRRSASGSKLQTAAAPAVTGTSSEKRRGRPPKAARLMDGLPPPPSGLCDEAVNLFGSSRPKSRVALAQSDEPATCQQLEVAVSGDDREHLVARVAEGGFPLLVHFLDFTQHETEFINSQHMAVCAETACGVCDCCNRLVSCHSCPECRYELCEGCPFAQCLLSCIVRYCRDDQSEELDDLADAWIVAGGSAVRKLVSNALFLRDMIRGMSAKRSPDVLKLLNTLALHKGNTRKKKKKRHRSSQQNTLHNENSEQHSREFQDTTLTIEQHRQCEMSGDMSVQMEVDGKKMSTNQLAKDSHMTLRLDRLAHDDITHAARSVQSAPACMKEEMPSDSDESSQSESSVVSLTPWDRALAVSDFTSNCQARDASQLDDRVNSQGISDVLALLEMREETVQCDGDTTNNQSDSIPPRNSPGSGNRTVSQPAVGQSVSCPDSSGRDWRSRLRSSANPGSLLLFPNQQPETTAVCKYWSSRDLQTHNLTASTGSESAAGGGTGTKISIQLPDYHCAEPKYLYRHGYPTIGTQRLAVAHLCLMCGSAGQERMVFCVLCCESFHLYCIERKRRPQTSASADPTDWVCRNCFFCRVCGEGLSCEDSAADDAAECKESVECFVCLKHFHTSCLDPRVAGGISHPVPPTWRCPACTTCHSCFALPQFEVNKDGRTISYCDSCYDKYESGDYCSVCMKMASSAQSDESKNSDAIPDTLSCIKCTRWVHTDCEGSTRHQIHLMRAYANRKSTSPSDEPLPFQCRSCISDRRKHWTEPAASMLKSGLKKLLHAVIQDAESCSGHLIQIKRAGPQTPQTVGEQRQAAEDDGCQQSLPGLKSIITKLRSDQTFTTLEEFHGLMQWTVQFSLKLFPEHELKTRRFCSCYEAQLHSTFPWARGSLSPLLPPAVAQQPPTVTSAISSQLRRQERQRANHDHTYYRGQTADEPNNNEEADEDKSVGKGEPMDVSTGVQSEAEEQSGQSDRRKCSLCLARGDRPEKLEGRLLFCGLDLWVHVNCALWSDLVYVGDRNKLLNVHSAIQRANNVRCLFCREHGASISCGDAECAVEYHFICARNINCGFYSDLRVFCQRHKKLAERSMPRNVFRVDRFKQLRQLFVDQDVNEGVGQTLAAPGDVTVSVGSLRVERLGEICSLSDTRHAILPAGFTISRLFWSTADPRKRTTYRLSVSEFFPPEEHNTAPDRLDYSSSTYHTPAIADRPPRVRHRSARDATWHVSAGGRRRSLSAHDITQDKLPNYRLPGSLNARSLKRHFHFGQRSAFHEMFGGGVDRVWRSGEGAEVHECPLCGRQLAASVTLQLHYPSCRGMGDNFLTSLARCVDAGFSGSRARRKGGGSMLARVYMRESARLANEVSRWPDHQLLHRPITLEKRSKRPHLLFKLESDDGFTVQANSIQEVWVSVWDALRSARWDANIASSLSECNIQPLRLSGLFQHGVKYLLEQLPGSALCSSYRFVFFHTPANAPLPLNLSGAARTEGYSGHRKPIDMFSWLSSRHRPFPHKRDLDDSSEAAMRRRQNAELPIQLRYRHLKKFARESCIVSKSRIHGRGLFCTDDIQPGDMVIEYTGQLIRSTLCDNRERYYQSKNIGCYMFRIDEKWVVDATQFGNAARFINHSCSPNCFSRVLNADGRKHIVIFANQHIGRGDEITYDYKFEIEDNSSKIPCLCHAPNCRDYLN